MHQFVYRIQPSRAEMLVSGATPSESAAIGEHFSYLEALAQKGVVLLAGRTLNSDEHTFGIVIFAAGSEAEAAEIMAKDPAVERRVMKAELFPFRASLLSQNWLGISQEIAPKKAAVAATADPTGYALVTFGPEHIAPAHALLRRTEGVGLISADEPAALEAFLARNPELSFAVLHEGQLVGTVLFGHDGRRGFIHHLVVAADHQRKGLGQRLLRRGLAALSSIGIEKCHLMVFKTNAAGIAFWKAMGGEERTSLTMFSVMTGEAK
jgi:GNAT superfamily N-acetyltransferase/uncharacterized protein YciI